MLLILFQFFFQRIALKIFRKLIYNNKKKQINLISILQPINLIAFFKLYFYSVIWNNIPFNGRFFIVFNSTFCVLKINVLRAVTQKKNLLSHDVLSNVTI